MAQRRRGLRRSAALLARRYGIGGKAAAVGMCASVILVAAVWGLHSHAAGQGVTLQRAPETETAPQAVTRDNGADESAKDTAQAADTAQPPIVHIDGGVHNPGVYELTGENPRINDAVERAGGLLPDADTAAVNLAAPATDGMKVHIPVAGEQTTWADDPPADTSSADTVSPSGGAGASGAGSLVNINTAGASELVGLPGVGEATAAAIIEDRERSGPFSTPEDLMRVPGIGEKKFAKLEGLICV